MNIGESSETAEQCLVDVKSWLEQPECTAEAVVKLLSAIKAQTKKDVALIASAVAMILNEKSEVLLLRRTPQDRSYPSTYSFPGGQKDPEDKDLATTALREAYEETGLVCEIIKPHNTLHSAVPRRERIYQITAFEMALAPTSPRTITLSPEHDQALFLLPKIALEKDADGSQPLAGAATRYWLRALMERR